MASNKATVTLHGCDSTGIALKVKCAMGRDRDHAPDEAIVSDVIIIPDVTDRYILVMSSRFFRRSDQTEVWVKMKDGCVGPNQA
ncbi:Os02g0656000 [Oryza sativa Japonica Group]|uniref:Os02g0656000 protein n=1 Tax=Oryza sativa subsp. japonica TaxID=39947 RepID=A0A0N7KFT3_ORYSJ|nr:Os02g0656000 [Oryza sativa Japonica Group]